MRLQLFNLWLLNLFDYLLKLRFSFSISILLHIAHEEIIGLLYFIKEVVVVIKGSLYLFKREIQDHSSDLTSVLLAHDLLDVLIYEFANYFFHVLVVRKYCGYYTMSFQIVSGNHWVTVSQRLSCSTNENAGRMLGVTILSWRNRIQLISQRFT